MYICEYLYGHTGVKLDPHSKVQSMHELIKKKSASSYQNEWKLPQVFITCLVTTCRKFLAV